MAAVPVSTLAIEDRWGMLAAELDADLEETGSPFGRERATLDVVTAELQLSEFDDDQKVMLRVRSRTGRLLNFDMWVPWDDISDATHEYAEVDGALVEHEYDPSKPEEVSRDLGRMVGEAGS